MFSGLLWVRIGFLWVDLFGFGFFGLVDALWFACEFYLVDCLGLLLIVLWFGLD